MPPLNSALREMQQVLRRNRGANVRRGRGDEGGSLPRRDVLEHDLESGKVSDDAPEHLIDEHAFAIEYIDLGPCHLAVDKKRQRVPLHRVEHRIHAFERGDAGIRVGGRPGGVVFHADDEAASPRLLDLGDGGIFGQVEREQGCKTRPGGQRGGDSFSIRCRRGNRGDRRLEIGHDDGTAEYARGRADHRAHWFPIPQVEVPIVGPGDRQRGHGHLEPSLPVRLYGLACTARLGI